MLFKPRHKKATRYANAYKHATKKTNRAIRRVRHQIGHIGTDGRCKDGVTKDSATFHDVSVDTTIKRRNGVGRPYTTYWFRGSDDWFYRVETKEAASLICWEISKPAMINSDRNLQLITDQATTTVKNQMNAQAFSKENPALKCGGYF